MTSNDNRMPNKHYPEEYTDVKGVRQLACVCGGKWPCPLFVPEKVIEYRTALNWAVNQSFQSVAARYARILGEELVRIQAIVPRWEIFGSLSDAVAYSDRWQCDRIKALTTRNDALRARVEELEAERNALRDQHIEEYREDKDVIRNLLN